VLGLARRKQRRIHPKILAAWRLGGLWKALS
jgi:hypothetical protein